MLKIIKLNGQKFKGPEGYWMPDGYCFKNDKGYLAFNGDLTPYIPGGGKKALQLILDGGGFTSESNIIFLQPIKEMD